MDRVQLLDTGAGTAERNMSMDAAILEGLDPKGPPVLHHYDWQGPCATYGYFVKPETLLDLEAAERHHLSLARRPTGGGVIFHVSDLAFSFFLPAEHPRFSANTLKNYALVNELVISALEKFSSGGLKGELLPDEPSESTWACQHFCMAKPTKYDVVIGGRKVGGAAQRRRRQGFLHQGSISLGMLPEIYLNEVLLPGTGVAEAMRENTFSLIDGTWSLGDLQEARSELRKCLSEVIRAAF